MNRAIDSSVAQFSRSGLDCSSHGTFGDVGAEIDSWPGFQPVNKSDW